MGDTEVGEGRREGREERNKDRGKVGGENISMDPLK